MDEEYDLKNRIKRLEDNMLRTKDFTEQLRIREVLMHYRRQLALIIQRNQRREQYDYSKY